MEPITRSEMLMDGQYVEPKTRKEMILAGEDLEPVTREEYFLKKYRHSGGDVDVVQLTATENKTYTAPEGKAYNPVKVNVPEPVLDSITINENGHFTPPAGTDGYDDITVYVPYVTQGTTINENGDYTPPSGVDGFGRVIVDVPTPPPSLQSLTASHNGYFLPSSGYVGFDEVTVDVALPQNAYLLESQKDDVVTIQHGVEFDMPKLIASIEPQQDLHGYDSPWVGGSGKNKLNPDYRVELAESTINYYLSNTQLSLSANTYCVSVSEACTISVFSYTGGQPTEIKKVYNSTSTSFTLESTSDIGVQFYKSGGFTNITNVKCQIEQGSTATSYAPYSNECPISGWTACNVVRTGKNLFDGSYPNIDGTVRYRSIYVGDGSFSFSTNAPLNSSQSANLFAFSGEVTSGGSTITNGFWSGVNKTFDSANGYITIAYRIMGDVDPQDYNVQIEKGSVTPYEPFGNTYTINFVDGSSPLTVYGGTLNVLSGLLTITDGYISSYNGETLPSTWISDRDVYAEGTTPTTGAEVCYKLATPQTYQLTPTEVKSLLGVNNIFADTGEVDVQIWTKEV